MKKNLPISPHLQIYKPQITSLLSITHRITGFGLNLALILLSLWIISFGLGSDVYANFVTIFAEDKTPGKPAPGCVPAPHKYRLLMPSAWL